MLARRPELYVTTWKRTALGLLTLLRLPSLLICADIAYVLYGPASSVIMDCFDQAGCSYFDFMNSIYKPAISRVIVWYAITALLIWLFLHFWGWRSAWYAAATGFVLGAAIPVISQTGFDVANSELGIAVVIMACTGAICALAAWRFAYRRTTATQP